MTALQDHTRSIIALSWSRMLGLPDEDLLGRPARHEITRADRSAVSFLQLFGHTVLSGPAEVLRRARDIDDAALAEERCLLDLARQHGEGARSRGASTLLYAEEPPSLGPSALGAVSYDQGHVREVLAESPADDVQVSGIAEASWSAALVSEDSGAALGAAGREVWSGMLAQLGVLTAPSRRGTGVGLHLGAVAAEEAFVEGLIPQWQAGSQSAGALRIAAQLGFTSAGTQTVVVFDRPAVDPPVIDQP